MFAAIHAVGNPELLRECARYFSPLVEETSGDTVVFEISGTEALFGPASTMARAIENRIGIPARIAIAADADAAIHAARGIPGVTVIQPGREAEALAPLPLNLLPGSASCADMLHSWGIRTFGELAALPPLGVAARLGDEGIQLQQMAKGQAGRQLRALSDPARFEEECELEYPVELLEPLLFVLARMLNDLCRRLASRALAANELRLTLHLESAPPHACRLRLPVPMRDAEAFRKLLHLELEARPPAAAVVKVFLGLDPVKPRTDQHGLFLAMAPEPERLEITIARLSNLLGTENVGTPEVLDSHRPDSFRMNRFSAVATAAAPLKTPVSNLTLRRFRPPKYAQVLLRGQRPAHVTSMAIEGRVLSAAGPWRSSGEWWQPEPWDHDEWDVALSDGAIYRLYEDRRTGRWFVEGNYD